MVDKLAHGAKRFVAGPATWLNNLVFLIHEVREVVAAHLLRNSGEQSGLLYSGSDWSDRLRKATCIPAHLTPEESPSAASGSQGDRKWWDLYQDEQLRTLIRTAIQQNYDARVAGTRFWRRGPNSGL